MSLSGKMPFLQRLVTLFVILLPFAGLVTAIVIVWGWGFDWIDLVLLLGMYVLTGLGITIGYHRLFTHKSFSTNPVVKAVLGVLGSMAVEGSILHWAAIHRCHHQHSDEGDDPHSPHDHDGGVGNMIRGLWRAHVGWMFEPMRFDGSRYVADLRRDGLVRRISALFPVWAVLGIVIPGVIAGLVGGTWIAALLGVLWGGLVRIFLVHHVTWSINSVCHIWGSRPYKSHDESRNNVIFGILGFGEGWHNNHHAFPTSARHGLRWWQLDTSYLLIWCMSKIGLARDVKVPTRDRMDAKRRPSS